MRQARRCPRGAVTPSRTAAYWIERLGLAPHPEGGYFRETYRAAESIPAEGLPARFAGPRTFSTAVYYLLQRDDVSALHRIAADEVWHHYTGAPLALTIIDPGGHLTTPVLGADAEHGESFQLVVPAGAWFGATLARAADEPEPSDAAVLGRGGHVDAAEQDPRRRPGATVHHRQARQHREAGKRPWPWRRLQFLATRRRSRP